MRMIRVLCRIGLHTWERWKDVEEVERMSINHGHPVDFGMIQSRRCLGCRLTQRRIEWLFQPEEMLDVRPESSPT